MLYQNDILLDPKNKIYFGIQNTFNAETLIDCKKTSFVWTQSPHSLCLALNKKYFELALKNPNILGIIAPTQAVISLQDRPKLGLIVAQKADELFYYIHNQGIHLENSETVTSENEALGDQSIYVARTASIDPTVVLGKNIWIGDNVVIQSGCTVLDHSVIKRNSVLYPNVTVGTEGFFSKYIMGKKQHIKHYGGVEIGENCILHAGTNISRSVNFQENTTIANNVHVGIQTNIGHDCQIGSDSDISAKVLLAGRVKVGQHCWIGAGATVSNALSIGDYARIMIGATVISDVPEQTTVSGNFARDHKKNLKQHLRSERL
ncbi:MAG: DapH/DapD/GlmU-related protein [Candidatus Electrothrix sp. Rat3]|nr:DapH/DapD/GlmU-related protein [Candidatus Electrothrix rattekaaiensis]